jgi:hypothetical protein
MLPSNRLFRLLAINAITGALLGVGFVICLMIFDTAGLRRLIAGDADGGVALALLTLGFVVMCSSVMMGSAIMQNHSDDGTSRDGGGPASPALAAVLIDRR